MQKRALAAFALALAAFSGSASAQILVQATDVIVDTTWGDNETEVILQQPIFVKSGATLTILAGTIVRGQPRSGPVVAGQVAGSPGALIVTQRGTLIATGAADDPIIMTTAAVDNNNDGNADDVDAPIGFEDEWVAGDIFLDDNPAGAPLAPLNKAGEQNVALWGGVVILGQAPTNLGSAAGLGTGKGVVEGLTVPGFAVADATYGGVESHDSSGIIQFISVRHAGDEIGTSNELNGITLAGVGDGTIFEFNEVYANFDDGMEWFGGTVSGNNLVVVFAGDDTFDMDQGYTGVNQFLFGVQGFFNENDGGLFGTGSGDKACEWDGDDAAIPNVNLSGPPKTPPATNPSPWPFSSIMVNNMTVIGSTPDSGVPGSAIDFAATSPAAANLGCQMINGFAGELRNSIVVNTGTQAGLDLAAGGATGWTTADNVAATADTDGDGVGDLIRVYCSTFDDGAGPLAGDEALALGNGNALAATASDNNVVNSAGFPGLNEEDQTFNPTGNAAGKLDATLVGGNGLLDPRPGAGLTGVGGCAGPTEPGTDGGAVYRGAFIRTAPTIWTTGWTVLNMAGLMAD